MGIGSWTISEVIKYLGENKNMPAELTEAEFSKHLNTKFHLQSEGDAKVEIELDEVKGYSSKHEEVAGMERFSAFFLGPDQPLLTQATYTLQHDQMGEFVIFLVPVARRGGRPRYEAVFNYYKKQ